MAFRKVAIFTIVNNLDMFYEFKSDLALQKNVSYELRPIMNCNGEYNSARIAFNENTDVDDGELYIFCHPDIRFVDEFSLSDFINKAEQIDDFGVIGVAGARRKENNREIVTTIVQGNKKEHIGRWIEEATPVQTVDECFFAIKKEYFKSHKFSDKEGWHLYAVEYCLEAIRNNKINYTVPSKIWHMSPGSSLDEKYMSQLELLIREYKNEQDMICTTVKAWPTRGFSAFLYRKYYWLKQWIKRMIVRR